MSNASRQYEDHIQSNGWDDYRGIKHIQVPAKDESKLLRAIETVNAHGMVVMSVELYNKITAN